MTPEQSVATDSGSTRGLAYFLAVAGSVLYVPLLYRVQGYALATPPTALGIAAIYIGGFIGAVALIRYYSRNQEIYLYIATGFLGASCFDALGHATASGYLQVPAALQPSAFAEWCWLSSRTFLGMMMFLNWVVWYRRRNRGVGAGVSAGSGRQVYFWSMLLWVLWLALLLKVPLAPPRAAYAGLPRLLEMIPGVLFGGALVGYIVKGRWREDGFEHWLTLSLIFGSVGQLLVMPFSGHPADNFSYAGNMIKLFGYACVLVGVLRSMYKLFQDADAASGRLAAQAEVLQQSLAFRNTMLMSANYAIVSLSPEGRILMANPAAERMLGYTADELAGRGSLAELIDRRDLEQRSRTLSLDLQKAVGPDFGALVARVSGGAPDEWQCRFLRKDGSGVPVQLSLSVLDDSRQRLMGYLGIASDISERLRVDQMKREFISMVSHELRTPLTSIGGALGLMAGGVAGVLPDQARSLVELARTNSQRLVRLINDILDVDRIESGALAFRPAPLDLQQLMELAVQANQGYAQEFGVRYSFQALPGKKLMVNADTDRLMQVMANLLSNAAKFSPKGVSIDVGVEAHTDRARISVTDHGPGIPEEFRGRIFGKFAQADSSDTRQKGGTGLGLSISKAIVERSNGRIGFDSVPGNTTFWFELPLLAAPPVTAAEAQPLAGQEAGRA